MKNGIISYLRDNALATLIITLSFITIGQTAFTDILSDAISIGKVPLWIIAAGSIIHFLLSCYGMNVIGYDKKKLFPNSWIFVLPRLSTLALLELFKKISLIFILSSIFLLTENVSSQYIKLSIYIFINGLAIAYISHLLKIYAAKTKPQRVKL